MKFAEPKVELITFAENDLITTSGDYPCDSDYTYICTGGDAYCGTYCPTCPGGVCTKYKWSS